MVQGEARSHIFPVKIARTESVGDLKDAIKDKKQLAFQHIDADALVLWEVSLSVDESLEEIVKNFDGGQPLPPLDKLSLMWTRRACISSWGDLLVRANSIPAL